MVRLNHSVKVDNRIITPFLIEGTNVLCFDKMKKTIILPLDKFKTIKKNKKLVIPTQITAPPIVPVAVISKITKPVKQEEPKEEIIVIKKEPIEDTFYASLKIRISGSAESSFTENEKIIKEEIKEIPPVFDNSRFVRPSLDDDYI